MTILAWMSCAMAPAPASAQISPGPLSTPHQALEGLRHCLDCHAVGNAAADAGCLDCHREISALREAKRGYHGLTALGKCAGCHPEHGGRGFELVKWDAGSPEKFDHRETGWLLKGKHRSTQCRRCHRPELRASDLAPRTVQGLPASSWLGLDTECASCHEDPHENRFGSKCADCHNADDFRTIEATSFDHSLTRFPLRGAHRDQACDRCHDPKVGWGEKPPFQTCAGCHADPHGGNATIAGRATDCSSCHNEERFRPSLYNAAMHSQTAYPLKGRHARVDCAGCHANGASARSSMLERARAFNFHPDHARCTSCHRDAHEGQLATRNDRGACESCHRVEGFSPSTFTVADHAATRLPLEGAHVKSDCRSCHKPRRSQGVSPASAVVLRFSSLECAACHEDPHEGTLDRLLVNEEHAMKGARSQKSGTCEACHDPETFHTTSVDAERHNAFSFRLQGAHAAVPCVECHRELQRPAGKRAPLSFSIEKSACADCHSDPHGGQFAPSASKGECSACHGESAFVPAVHFDHERDTAFPLKSAHEGVACEACHSSAAGKGVPPEIRYRPIPHRCEDCHGAEKGGDS